MIGMPYRGISSMIQKTELTWATVNTQDPVDANGELLTHELPPDMLPGAQRDFGG
jgi:hypothetical protein